MASAPLEGPRRTVPRSELRAFLEVLERSGDYDIEVVTDCAYVVNGAAVADRPSFLCGTSGDYWAR
eukprot:9909608-Lingulodinium_polyedra.AAC.1